MNVTWLGWAGVEIEAQGETIVIDPLQDAGAVFAAFGKLAEGIEVPPIVRAPSAGRSLAGLVSHLHRDHTDADALTAALAPSAHVFGPPHGAGGELEELGTAQAAAELQRAGLAIDEVGAWSTRDVGPFRITAVPAVDGSGDPQVSWVVEADGRRLIHAGDTMWHSFWWRMVHRLGAFDLALLPVNGAQIDFPHRQPPSRLPAVMTPEHAAVAAAALQAGVAVPIHFGGYDFDPYYRPMGDEERRFVQAARARGVEALTLKPGQGIDLSSLPERAVVG
jgi:L-ascorbate metabolism protein UlaG (beta-lactamase superfamily)